MASPRLLCLLMLVFSFSIIGCNTESNTDEETVATDQHEEETSEPEDKSQRPSPPARATGTVNGINVTVDYSQPGVKERKIFGAGDDALVPYGKVWRTGANEATWVEFDQDVMVEGKSLPAGKYGFFTIPDNDQWVIIFNKVWDQWGAYEYEEEDDILRFTVKPETSVQPTERLTFEVKDGIVFRWADKMFKLNVQPAA